MPIDPRIALSTVVAQPLNAEVTRRGVLENQQIAADLQQQKAAGAMHQALAEAAQRHPGDIEGFLGEAMTIAPDLAMKWTKDYQDAQTAKFTLQTRALELKRATYEAIGNIAAGSTDEDSYQIARAQVGTMFGPEAVQQMPPTFNPQWVAQQKQMLLTESERLQAELRQIEEAGRQFRHTTPQATAPQSFTLGPGQRRFNEQGQVIAEVPPNPSATAGFTLSPGQTRYDAQGQAVASRPPTPPAATAAPTATMDPAYANALDRAILMIPAVRRPAVLGLANRLAEAGNTEELKQVIRQAAIEGENVETQRQVEGRMNATAALADIEAMLKELQSMGVSTNILRGTVEDMAARLGTSTDTRLRELGTRIADTFVEYRRSLTGVAFSQREADEYRRLFPNYGNTLPVNLAVIAGLRRGMATRDRAFWERKLGADGARLVGAIPDTSEPEAISTPTPAPARANPFR